jgi:hypothetical protein
MREVMTWSNHALKRPAAVAAAIPRSVAAVAKLGRSALLHPHAHWFASEGNGKGGWKREFYRDVE